MTSLISGMIAKLEAAHAHYAQMEAETDSRIAAEEIETANRAKLVVQTGQTNSADSVRFSPDGRMLVSTGSMGDSFILWDASSGQQLKAMSGHARSDKAAAKTAGQDALSLEQESRRWNDYGSQVIYITKLLSSSDLHFHDL